MKKILFLLLFVVTFASGQNVFKDIQLKNVVTATVYTRTGVGYIMYDPALGGFQFKDATGWYDPRVIAGGGAFWPLTGTPSLTGAFTMDQADNALNIGLDGSATTNNARFGTQISGATRTAFMQSTNALTTNIATVTAQTTATFARYIYSVNFGGGTTQRQLDLKSDVAGIGVTDTSLKGLFYVADYNSGGTQTDRSIVDFGGIKDKTYTFTNKSLSGFSNTFTNIPAATAISGRLPYANLTAATGASKLFGRQSGSAGDWQEITIGSGLVMTGTTLDATGGTAAGSDTQVQINDTGSLAGDAGMVYNKTTDVLTTKIAPPAATANPGIYLQAIGGSFNVGVPNGSFGFSNGFGINSETIIWRNSIATVYGLGSWSSMPVGRIPFVTVAGTTVGDDADLSFDFGTNTFSTFDIAAADDVIAGGNVEATEDVKAGNAIFIRNIALAGGRMNVQYTNVSNVTTTETDLYSFTVPAVSLTDGEIFEINYAVDFTDASGTTTCRIRIYFGGQVVFDMPWLVNNAAIVGGKCEVINTSSSARCVCSYTSVNATHFMTVTDLGSVNFATTNVFKVTGTASGATATSGDIVGKYATFDYKMTH